MTTEYLELSGDPLATPLWKKTLLSWAFAGAVAGTALANAINQNKEHPSPAIPLGTIFISAIAIGLNRGMTALSYNGDILKMMTSDKLNASHIMAKTEPVNPTAAKEIGKASAYISYTGGKGVFTTAAAGLLTTGAVLAAQKTGVASEILLPFTITYLADGLHKCLCAHNIRQGNWSIIDKEKLAQPTAQTP